jgi:hypothetical protein
MTTHTYFPFTGVLIGEYDLYLFFVPEFYFFLFLPCSFLSCLWGRRLAPALPHS